MDFIKKHKYKLLIALLIVLFLLFKPQEKAELETWIVNTQDISQEVSVVGTVKAAQKAQLAFEVGGKLQNVNVTVNDEVQQGQLLASLNSSDLNANLMNKRALLQAEVAQLDQIKALLDAEQSKLEDLSKGAKPAEISLKEVELSNAKSKLEQEKKELINLTNKLNSDIDANFAILEGLVRKSFTKNYNALVELTDIQYDSFFGSNQHSVELATNKQPIVKILLGESSGGRFNKISISNLSGGLKSELNKISLSKQETLDTYDQLMQSVGLTVVAFNSIDLNTQVSASIQTNIQTQVTDLELARNELIKQKATLDQLIHSYENSLDAKRNTVLSAENALKSAESNLELSKSGASADALAGQKALVRRYQSDLVTQEAQIMAARALVSDANAQISKRKIRAPFKGKITEKFFELGEIILAQAAMFEIISEAEYQITANVPESDIAKIKIGQSTFLTLDAYDQQTKFAASISKINPAAKEIEGVPVYEVTLNFIEASDLIKSGMTANLDILTQQVKNVLAIPLRAVNDGYVRVIDDSQQGYKKVKVQTGLVGTDGFIEIKSGLKQDDEIITFLEETDE